VTTAAGQHEGLSSRETAERKAKKKEGRKMKRKIFYGLGAMIAGGLTLAAVANGPYYALPAWAQKLACATTSNCPRFIVLADWNSEAVLDRETGLVWEKSVGSAESDRQFWVQALSHCNNITVGNRKGWRLPTAQELASLLDPTRANPSLPAGHPFTNIQRPGINESIFAWSATNSVDPDSAWGVFFLNGDVFTDGKDGSNFVWCVRAGQGVDPQ
jgi:hypothetical protein